MKKLILALGAAFTVASCAAACASEFIYDEETSGPSPIPAAERGLKTETAKRWLRVSDGQQELEGAAFGFDGCLYFCNENLRSVMKVTKDKKIEKVLTLDGYLWRSAAAECTSPRSTRGRERASSHPSSPTAQTFDMKSRRKPDTSRTTSRSTAAAASILL